jgi:hypothetical protein
VGEEERQRGLRLGRKGGPGSQGRRQSASDVLVCRQYTGEDEGVGTSLKCCFAWRRGLTAKMLLSFDAKRAALICCLHDCMGEPIASQSEPYYSHL